MTEASDKPMFGFTPDDWAKLPEHIQSHLLSMNASVAEAHHAERRAQMLGTESQLWAMAGTVIKTLLSVNGGALVAILAFLASMAASNKDLWLWHLAAALVSFGVGAAIAIVAAIFAFFTGSAQFEALKSMKPKFEPPYIEETADTGTQYRNANVLRFIAIGCCVLALTSAIIGCFLFLQFAMAALAG